MEMLPLWPDEGKSIESVARRRTVCPQCGGPMWSKATQTCRACATWQGPTREKVCNGCSASFLPHNGRQVYCDACLPPCPDCGGKKHREAVRCRACENRLGTRLGKRGGQPGSAVAIAPIDGIVTWAEELGLQVSHEYAFGYVIGVVFGDGSVSLKREKDRHRNRNGSISTYTKLMYRPSLDVTARAFAEEFARQWGVLTGREPAVRPYTYTQKTSSLPTVPQGYTVHIYRVTPSHNRLARYLHHIKYIAGAAYLRNFRDEQVMRGILQGMIDSEGSQYQRYIAVHNKDFTLLEVLREICARLGYRATRIYVSPSLASGTAKICVYSDLRKRVDAS